MGQGIRSDYLLSRFADFELSLAGTAGTSIKKPLKQIAWMALPALSKSKDMFQTPIQGRFTIQLYEKHAMRWVFELLHNEDPCRLPSFGDLCENSPVPSRRGWQFTIPNMGVGQN